MNHSTAILCEEALLLALFITATGCRTFNYTEEDLEHERQLIREGMAHPEYGRSMGGGVHIGNFCPNIGGGVCPGK
jgi:hypothetical protein